MILGAICVSRPVQAQSKVGTTIGQVLLIEPSARLTGMGNAGVTMYDEVESAFYNPGAIGRMERNGVQFTHSLWLADIEYNYVGASIRAGDVGNIYVSLTSLNSGEIEVTTVEQPLGTGERYTVSDFALGLGFGRKVTDRFSVGVQVNYYKQTIWHSSISTVAFNAGTVYCISENGLRIGASLANFGLPARFDGRDLRILYDSNPDRFGDNSSYPAQFVTDKFSLPVFFRVGIGLPVNLNRSNSLLVSVDAFHPSDNTESVSFGAEWNFLDVFSLRGGYQNLMLKDSEVGLTFGAGLEYDFGGYVFTFDYGWADYGRLENTQRFSLGLTF
jgi:long-subunit fatty acid transport protein